MSGKGDAHGALSMPDAPQDNGARRGAPLAFNLCGAPLEFDRCGAPLGVDGCGAPLGFGTSALMSRVGRTGSLRLLETALDAGITHFDTARSYGFGEAESVVGMALSRRRDRVTITTKVGILPPQRPALLRPGKALARGVLGIFPGLRSAVRRRAGSLVQADRFETAAMRASLHTSLRQLRTEYVDFLLLHEPSRSVLDSEEAWAFLDEARRQGKVRAFGVAATPEVAAYALAHASAYTDVLQVPHGMFSQRLTGLETGARRRFFLHSALGQHFSALLTELEGDAPRCKRWSAALGVDIVAPGQLARLCLHWALKEVPGGTVLFSSLNPAHVRENAAVLDTAAQGKQLQTFEALVGKKN